jgi:hypothetical protein
MYNLVLDKKFTGPLGKFSPGPVPVKNKISIPVSPGPGPLCSSLERRAPRLSVESLMSHVLEAIILTGCAKWKDVFIPRIPIIPTDMPFEFKREGVGVIRTMLNISWGDDFHALIKDLDERIY